MTTVLLADPDKRSRRAEAAALRHGGFGVEIARSAKETFSLLRRRAVEAVVLDPTGIDGVDLVQDLRGRTAVPIIVISPAAEELDKVAALDAGADDYLSKPFGVEELLARLRAALRRTLPRADRPPAVTADFTVDFGARRVRRTGRSDVALTPTQWCIVEALGRHPGHVVTHAQLLEEVWGPGARDKTHYLRVHMAGLRRKLEPDPSHPRYFITCAGLGHMFVPEGSDGATGADGRGSDS